MAVLGARRLLQRPQLGLLDATGAGAVGVLHLEGAVAIDNQYDALVVLPSLLVAVDEALHRHAYGVGVVAAARVLQDPQPLELDALGDLVLVLGAVHGLGVEGDVEGQLAALLSAVDGGDAAGEKLPPHDVVPLPRLDAHAHAVHERRHDPGPDEVRRGAPVVERNVVRAVPVDGGHRPGQPLVPLIGPRLHAVAHVDLNLRRPRGFSLRLSLWLLLCWYWRWFGFGRRLRRRARLRLEGADVLLLHVPHAAAILVQQHVEAGLRHQEDAPGVPRGADGGAGGALAGLYAVALA
mmetsp:Transcript_25863/g.80980  ORF Transcript_25863/g.80980 Transcript_25863/m.80980 type:complete len:294 (-) Transcript_25863:634-1515(-)